MPKSQFQQTSFASGELSPLLKGRTDLEQYYKGAQDAEGVVIVPQGGVKRRPGLEHIDDVLFPLVRQTDVNPTTPDAAAGQGALMNDGKPDFGGVTNYSVSASPYVVAQYDFASYVPKFISIEGAFIRKRVTTATDISKELYLKYSSDGTSWTLFKTIPVSSAADVGGISKRYDVTGISDANNRYWRIETNLGNEADYAIYIGEFNAHRPVGPSVTPKVFEWQYAPDHNFVCVLTQYNMRIYRTPHLGSSDTVYVADIPMPYTGAYGSPTATISTVRVAQTENVMLLFQEDTIPYKIVFSGTDGVDAFSSNYQNFINNPQYDYNDDLSPPPVSAVQKASFSGFHVGQLYQVIVNGVLSKDIVYAGDSNANEQAATAANLARNLQDMPVFGFTGISVERTASNEYTITMAGESANSYGLFSGFPTSGGTSDTIGFVLTTTGTARTENVWSDTRGWPKMGVLHQGRLWIGGTKSKPQSIIASRAGSFFDFFSEKGEDDEGIFITIDSREQTNIIDINPDRGLQVFCSGAEFLVKGITPSTIEVIAQTQHGAYDLEVQSIDGATLFMDRNGNTLRQYLFSFNEDAYTSNDISVLSSQLVSNPKDMAILKGTTTEDSNWLFIINQDGNAGVLNTMRNQDINGFTRWTTANPSGVTNFLNSCCTVEDELYVITGRSIGGSGGFHVLERWNFDRMLDASVKKTVTATGSDVVVSLGTQLSGANVDVLADGDVLPSRACTGVNGDITITAAELDGFSSRSIEAGYNFPVKVKGMPINTNPGTRGGQNTMKRKKITNINLRVYESAGIYIDGNAVPIRQFGDAQDTPLNTPFVPRTGIIEDDNGGNGWATEVVPEITVPDATPFHLQAIQYEVESS
jgi:hypothetical protein